MIFLMRILLSLGLGCVFLASSIPKLYNPKGFALAVVEYRVLPIHLGLLFGQLLPPLEFFLALLLLSGVEVRLVTLILFFLLLSFLFAISINMGRGRDLDCHCFGVVRQRKIGWQTLLQDGLLLCMAGILVGLASNWMGLEPWSIFRFISTGMTQYLVPLFLCFGVTLAVTVVLRRKPIVARRKRVSKSEMVSKL